MRHRTRARAALTVVLLAAVAGCGASESADPIDAGGDAASGAEEIDAPATTETAASDDSATTDAPTTDAPAAEETPASDPTTDASDDDAQPVESQSDGADAADAPGVIEVSMTADERTAADDPVAQAITSAFPPGFAPPSDVQAQCVGGKIVNELGTDRLAELGITAESVDIFGATDFTTAEVDAMVDILFECVDVEFMVASMFAPAAGPETAECFADFVDENLIRDLAAPFLGGGALDAEVFLEQVAAANAVCLSADG